MVTIELMGGLGNQMFQYALAVKMQRLGKDVRIASLFGDNTLRKYELHCFKGIDEKYFETDTTVTGKFATFFDIIHKLRGKKKGFSYCDKIIVYQPEIFDFEDVVLKGYWQNEKYFSDIRDDILRIFSFKHDIVCAWEANIEKKLGIKLGLENENSVSVHVRRQDYCSPDNMECYGGICTIDYYKNAIHYMKERIDEPKFYLFSDDMEWVERELLPAVNTEGSNAFISIKTECKDTAFDMWMMTRCRHNIIANSTYSWWGAWLGKSNDKIVISPQKWMNGYSDDIICSDWIRI